MNNVKNVKEFIKKKQKNELQFLKIKKLKNYLSNNYENYEFKI